MLENNYNVSVITRDEEKAKKFDWFKDVNLILQDINYGAENLTIPINVKVIHLAWQNLPNYNSQFHIDCNLPHHYKFLRELLEKGVKHFLVTGTCFEYGNQSGAIKSSAHCYPNNPYAYAKDALHKQLRFLQREQPFNLQWTRLFYMYGKGQNATSIISQLDEAIDNNKKIFNMSGGEQLRDYLKVEEVVKQIYALFKNGQNGVYNVCSGKPISIRHLVEKHILKRRSKIKLNLGFYPYSKHEPMEFWGEKDYV